MSKILIGALTLVTIAIVFGALFARECRAATAEADRQSQLLLQAMDRADYAAAFSLFCTDGLSSADISAAYADFKSNFEESAAYFDGYVHHSTSGTGLTVSTTDSRQLDYEAEVTFSDGSVGQFVATFLKQNGHWCLQDFDLTGRPLPTRHPVSGAEGTPTAAPAGGSANARLTEVTLPLLREYVRAVGRASEATPGDSSTYAQAVENPQLQAAFEDAFRRAQDILEASTIDAPDDRDCVNALREWSRFATDYWNSLARASIDKNPNRWTYALRFEGELHYRQGQLTSACPAPIGALGTSLDGTSVTQSTDAHWKVQ